MLLAEIWQWEWPGDKAKYAVHLYNQAYFMPNNTAAHVLLKWHLDTAFARSDAVATIYFMASLCAATV